MDSRNGGDLLCLAPPTHSWGQRWVHQGPRGGKINFSKVVPRPLGMLKHVFLAHFEPVVMRFGPWKIPNSLQMGPKMSPKWVQNVFF